mmetsp:Transcript_32792/g.48833  ORF Transcript_32792/g.48833 Transcript_32792/m.48833 type:complete len:310 (-) Transcript_32792:34-963(-)
MRTNRELTMDIMKDEIELREAQSFSRISNKESDDLVDVIDEFNFEDTQVGDDEWVSPLISPLPQPEFIVLKTPEMCKDSLDSDNFEMQICPIPYIPHLELAKPESCKPYPVQYPETGAAPVTKMERCQIHFESEEKTMPMKNDSAIDQDCLNSNNSTTHFELNQKDYSVALRSLASRMRQSEITKMQLEKFTPYKKRQGRKSLNATLDVSSASRKQIKRLIDYDLMNSQNASHITRRNSEGTAQIKNNLNMRLKSSTRTVSAEWTQNEDVVSRQSSPPALQYADNYFQAEKASAKGHQAHFHRRHSTLV